MANTKEVAKATITSTTQDNLVVLPPKIQTQVKVLREARNIAKQAKATGDTSRDAILDFVGETSVEVVGTDAKGKRLISVKVIQSPESFDWKSLKENDPELHSLVQKYKIAKGSGTPTLRVDIL
jgi:hypothetical protein